MSSSSERDLLIVACAVSAGVHGALAPAHFHESFAEGAGFVAATVLLVCVAAVLGYRPEHRVATAGAELVFAGLLVSYAAAATTGIPLLHPEIEPVDGLALATKVVELVGLGFAVALTRGRAPKSLPFPALGLALLIAVFSAQVALSLSGGHHNHMVMTTQQAP